MKFTACSKTCALVLLCAGTAIVSQAQNFKTLVIFNSYNGASPGNEALVQGANGNLFGTTSGGPNENGTVFEMTPNGRLVTLHNFCSQPNCADGWQPLSGLVLASDGKFYGTTSGGGQDGCCGTIFNVSAHAQLTTLYSFCWDCAGPSDVLAPLVQAVDRSFYSTTNEGGGFNEGTVYNITPAGEVTTLHSFSCSDGNGCFPTTRPVQATDGDFYGTTSGTVFKITPHGTLTTLYKFCSQPNCADGSNPSALIQALDGNFYGTTSAGGVSGVEPCYWEGCGTIFKVTPDGVLTTLYSFCPNAPDCPDGTTPTAGLVQATDGNFYGTTTSGGSNNGGTIFQITPSGRLTTLYSFCSQPNCKDGTGASWLYQHTDGTFFGTTSIGGDYRCQAPYAPGCGTVFSLSTGLGPFVTFVRPAGKIGETGGILGQGFTGTTSVELNGTPAQFDVVSDTYLTATVPAGATTGFVTVTTPTGVLTSNVPFHVIP